MSEIKNKEELLNQMKKMGHNCDVNFIGIDDSFGFKCQQCGACCMNREDIILNPFDIYNGAKYLGITCEDFILNYTKVDIGCNSKIPMVLLRTSDNGFCPLLKFDVKDGGKFKCAVHEAKPSACANHPIGVAYGVDKTTGVTHTDFVKVEQCPNSVSDEMHTVREFVQSYLDHQDEYNAAHDLQHLPAMCFDTRDFWFTAGLMSSLIKKGHAKGELPDELLDEEEGLPSLSQHYLQTVITLAYANYDIQKPYVEQARENEKELKSYLDATNELYKKVKLLLQVPEDSSVEETIKNGFFDFLKTKDMEEVEDGSSN